MYSLLIDTHMEFINLVIYRNGKVFDNIKKESAQNHSVYAVSLLNSLLEKNKINTKELKEIFVVNGPGSFTGVRIGVTIAKTLAWSLNIPIKVIFSLEILALHYEGKKIVYLSDRNGKYIGKFNEKNKATEDYFYLSNSEFELFKQKNKVLTFNKDWDYNKIYEFLKEKKAINSHKVNPIYIKNIEVVNGKKS